MTKSQVLSQEEFRSLLNLLATIDRGDDPPSPLVRVYYDKCYTAYCMIVNQLQEDVKNLYRIETERDQLKAQVYVLEQEVNDLTNVLNRLRNNF